ncbi:MAG: SRPBCC domain-containing protein [Nitrososphaerota archaeon]|nr:SRPBCC domain-containing protein [Nitrososphaerota archaeon]
MSHSFFIRAPPQKVFEALTDPKWLIKWGPDIAKVSRRKGGSYSFGFEGGRWVHSGKILEYVSGASVSYSWEWPGVELLGTKLRFAVRPKKGGALLDVEHSGFPKIGRWTDLYGVTEWGWTYYAMNLKSVLETGYDLRSRDDA